MEEVISLNGRKYLFVINIIKMLVNDGVLAGGDAITDKGWAMFEQLKEARFIPTMRDIHSIVSHKCPGSKEEQLAMVQLISDKINSIYNIES